MDKAEIDVRFTFHPASPEQAKVYQTIRDNAKQLAYLLYSVVPDSRELSLALTSLEETVMWANAGVARRG